MVYDFLLSISDIVVQHVNENHFIIHALSKYIRSMFFFQVYPIHVFLSNKGAILIKQSLQIVFLAILAVQVLLLFFSSCKENCILDGQFQKRRKIVFFFLVLNFLTRD